MPLGLTFTRRDGSWRLAGDSDARDQLDRQDAYAPWNDAPVEVATGERSVVVADRGGRRSARELATLADAAVRRVETVWPAGGSGADHWSGRVVLFAPKDAAAWADYSLGDADVGALTEPLGGEVTGGPSGVRVVLAPDPSAGTDDIAYVLTHEVTHVATAGLLDEHAPTWLAEGMAEYVAISTLAPGPPGPDMLDDATYEDASRGRYRFHLPTEGDFHDANSATVEASYTAAWLACSEIDHRKGSGALLEVFRRVGTDPAEPDPDRRFAAALRNVLGTTPAAFGRAISARVNGWVRQG